MQPTQGSCRVEAPAGLLSQVKYLQPVESITQASVHLSCPKDLVETYAAHVKG